MLAVHCAAAGLPTKCLFNGKLLARMDRREALLGIAEKLPKFE
jgi:hypothetical protein